VLPKPVPPVGRRGRVLPVQEELGARLSPVLLFGRRLPFGSAGPGARFIIPSSVVFLLLASSSSSGPYADLRTYARTRVCVYKRSWSVVGTPRAPRPHPQEHPKSAPRRLRRPALALAPTHLRTHARTRARVFTRGVGLSSAPTALVWLGRLPVWLGRLPVWLGRWPVWLGRAGGSFSSEGWPV
jgi:hypothetical protein